MWQTEFQKRLVKIRFKLTFWAAMSYTNFSRIFSRSLKKTIALPKKAIK